MSDFETSMARLNPSQREAVNHMDGPLLVVASPGTGKTQILSLRAANILKERDVQPKNILCLTYTDVGAEAMRKRLIELVGRNAYGIEVSTFHSFATSIKSRYPEYFRRNPSNAAASDLHTSEVIDAYLKKLPYNSPLSAIGRGGLAYYLGDVSSFISKLKRSGLAPETIRAIALQNIAAADYLDANDELMGLVNTRVPSSTNGKGEFIARFERSVSETCRCAPPELTTPVVTTPGVYVPYVEWLRSLVARTELIGEDGKTSGYSDIRGKEFEGKEGSRRASIRVASEKTLAAADAYASYQETLAEEGLVDFDDMIMDCIQAIEESPELRHALQDRYRYIQVDEFQDTNGAQMRIVELLSEELDAPNVMAVGDDDQAIMRFQGASVEYIQQFKERFKPHEVVLSINYRSTPQIVELGSSISTQVEKRLVDDKSITAFREGGGQLEFKETVFPAPELEYRALARDIRKRIDAGFIDSCEDPDEAVAVIARKHAQLRALIPYLIEEGVPFSYKQKTNALELESTQTLLALLHFVSLYSQGRKERAVAYLPEIVAARELGGEHVSSVRFALNARKDFNGDWLKALEKSENPRLSELYENLMQWSAQAPSSPVRELVFKIAGRSLRYYSKLADTNPFTYAEFNSGIRVILDFVEGELGTAAGLGRTLRLADVVERLDQARRFGVKIDASIDLGTHGAVRLTSAHSSKGLEFDLVYLLDADDKSWHSGGSSSGLYANNMLIAESPDEDDDKRLLFVAATRAKSYLELYRSGSEMLREFRGDEDAGETDTIGSVEGEYDAQDLGEAVLTDWHQSYHADTPELQELLKAFLPPRSLSATALNMFVAYDAKEGPASMAFPENSLMRLPDEPKIFFDFGHIVHAYLDDYVTRVLGAGDMGADELARLCQAEAARMDYREEDVSQYVDKFECIAREFGTWANGRLEGELKTEAAIEAMTPDGVPLFGFCDLLIIDREKKTVRVVDYKTGQGYPKGEPEPAYARQLRFYRLLVENSSEYAGYRVTSCENWYVEPDKNTGEMHDPVAISVADADIEQLNKLVNAVWRRLEDGDFDTTAFEESELKEQAAMVKGSKAQRAAAFQRVYEQWLIEQDEVREFSE